MTSNLPKVLVTGGAGFIGSHLVDRLLHDGFEVIVIDNLETGRLQNIDQYQANERLSLIQGDIRDFNLVKKVVKGVYSIFHEAALASVIFSVENPVMCNDVNVVGTLNLLKAASDFNVEHFIYASSAAVYGNISSPRKREDMTPNPTSPYGVSKLAAEHYVRLWYRLYGVETVSLRYFNVYGPRQRFDIECAYGGAITIFTNRLLRNMPPIVYGDGKQTRDFVYIGDVVEANMLALTSEKSPGEVINIATGENTSVNQVAETLKGIMSKKDLETIHADPRPTDIRHGYADISKAKKLLGYRPRFHLEEGLNKLVNWYITRNHLPDESGH